MAIDGKVAPLWEELVERDELVLCLPVRVELLYSARGRADYVALAVGLDGFRSLPIEEPVETIARRTHAALAELSLHRGPTPVDVSSPRLRSAIRRRFSITTATSKRS